jgi:hypothetical protein
MDGGNSLKLAPSTPQVEPGVPYFLPAKSQTMGAKRDTVICSSTQEMQFDNGLRPIDASLGKEQDIAVTSILHLLLRHYLHLQNLTDK